MALELIRQSNFNGGELSPQAIGRRDLKAYASSLALSVNMVARPEGPITRRPGLRHIDRVRNILAKLDTDAVTVTAPNGGDGAAILDGSGFVTGTDLGATRPYVVAEFDFGAPVEVGLIDLINFALVPTGTSGGGGGGGGDPGDPTGPGGTDPAPPQYPWTGNGELQREAE